MVKFLVVEHLNGSGVVSEIATFDNYEAAVSLIEDMRGGIYSIEKRWYI